VGSTAVLIGVAYAVVVVLSVVVAAVIAASTRSRLAVDARRLAENEKRWLLVVVAILLALLLATIWFTPYGESAGADAQVVRVDASQFLWRISPQRVRAGTPVEFRLTSSDVNHGFGIYRGTEFVAQIQVVPEKTQELVHTFSTPGVYTILCLEFCGVGHHDMKTTFRVTR
jgi:cytochrome c oxidase subunit II